MGKTTYVYSGIGTQWPGMAAGLLEGAHALAGFSAALDEVDRIFDRQAGWSVRTLLVDPGFDGMAQPARSHAAIFALQAALTLALAEHGRRPAAVLGHSGGEVAAAVAAGVLSLEDAVALVLAHGELMDTTPAGAMLHVELAPGDIDAHLSHHAGRIELAVHNSASAAVLAGDADAIGLLAQELEGAGIACRPLRIRVPFHSQAVEPALDRFRARLAKLAPREPSIPIYSAWRGGLAAAGDFDADYWVRHVREPVRFYEAAQAMLVDGVATCVEISPHPVLLQHISAIARNPDLHCIATLHREMGALPLHEWLNETASPPHPPAQESPDATALTAVLRGILAELLPGTTFPADWQDLTWSELGLKSVQLVALGKRVTERLGIALPVTLAYRCPTPSSLAAHLAGKSAAAAEQPATCRSPSATDAVAIVGLACRFPGGANTPAQYWSLLSSGRDPIREIPADRWPAMDYYAPTAGTPGKSVSRWAGFLADCDLQGFDDKLFRVSPREASALDPQQRLLLEVAWEALENAGIPPLSLKGRRVAVYLGISTDDYKTASFYTPDLAAIDPYAGAGALGCTAGGRLSYFFGWQGPNLSIDTACSSSLVALHQARQALLAGECELAVVAGVNLMLAPHLFVYFSQVGALSPTGRCHTFDAAADGYVRAEGCGVLILEREADALKNRRRQRARVAGSAVNQDGASTGFSAPNGAAQTDVIAAAWRAAGARAADIAYVEAHGTGTPIGDPIELESLAAAAPERTSADPLLVGSVKSHIGHLEAAAGVAGVIKLVLALEHGELPGNFGFTTPNPRLDWAHLPLKVVDRATPFPARGARRLAGISSFGFSGTNAHAVLEGIETSQTTVPPAPTSGVVPPDIHSFVLQLSAHNEAALKALAQATASALSDHPAPADFVWSSNTGRQPFAQRLGVAARSQRDLAEALAAWASGQPVPPAARAATGQGNAPALVFGYTGQGCQYPGMAQQLYETEAVFRAVVDRCDARFAELRGRSLKHFLIDPASSADELEAIELAQPAVFMVQVALTELLASWGIRPARIVGHSAGEVAAGVAAGVLTLEEGISLIEARSRLMGAHPPGGGMASVPVDEATARAAIANVATAAPDEVFVAVINSPETVVLSGASAALDKVLAELGAAGRQARRLRISNAFHTPLLTPVADGLVAHCRAHLPGIGRSGHTEWLSSVDGRNLGAGGTVAEYWAEQLLAPVRFHDTLSRLEEQPGSYVEIGPAAVLTALGSERPAGKDGRAAWIATQQRQMDGALTLAGAVAAIAARGHRIDWDALAGGPRQRTDLPPYPFQRRRHWRAPILPASGGQAASQPTSQPASPTVSSAPTFQMQPQPQVPAMTSASPPAVDSVRALIAEITGFPLADIVPDVPLLDLGLDSLMLVQLKGHLEARHGVSVKLAEFYDQLDTAEKVAALLPATSAAPATPAAAPCAMPQPAAHFAAPAALAKPAAGVEGLMAMQLEALSRLMSEQLAVLGQAPAALPAAATHAAPVQAAPKAEPPAQMPNFRSLKLDADTLTAPQQAFVADLTRRYVAKTGGSRRLAAEHRGPLADWKNTLSYRHTLKEMTYPIAAVRSKGAYFTDVDGNEFLDITMGCGIVILGHAPDAVVAAVQEQAAAHYAIGPQTPLAADVAELFCRMVGMERVTFCNTGAEAVMMAVRIARAVTGRRKIALFAGAYHGTWDGVLGVEHDGHVWPIAAGIPPGMVEDLVILNYGTDEALAAIRAQAHEFAAVLVEPVQSRRPSLQPAAFLRELRTITANAGCALIFDEMINGFRIGPGGAQAHFGVRADLATYGKIAGGGLPMSAVAGSARFLDSVDGGPWNYGDDSHPGGDVVYFGGTYVKHPLALAAAKTALAELERLGEAGYAELNARSQRFADTLNAWFAEEQVPMQVAHFGSQFRFDGSGKYSALMQPIELDLFFFLLILKGIYVWERRVLFLSFAHGEAEIERIVATVKEAVRELRAGGFEFRTAGAGGIAPGKSEGKRDAAAGPASFAQRRLYALTQLEGRNTVYNVPLALDIAGRLDAARLEDCFRKILARHEALRTRFGIENDELTQRVVPLAEIDFAVERRDCTATGFTAAAEAFIRPFELDRAPLFRVLLLSDGATRHALVMDAHHIVVDGLALNILARELMALYEGRALPPLTVRPLDAVATQAAYLASAACQEDAAWWRARFASLPPLLELPLDKPRLPRRSHRGGDCLAIIDKQATAALKTAAKTKRLTLFGLALGVFGGFLHRLTGQDDIVIGLPVGGRDDPRYADLIGMFANTLPLRLNVGGDQPLGEHARAAQKEFLVALEHQAYPLEALIAGLKLPRDLARNPLFDTMFIFEDGNDRVYRMAGLECRPLPASRHAAMFDLAMEVIEAEGELQLRLEYDADLFEPASAARLLDIYRRLLVQAPASLDLPLSELDCVPAEERAQLLAWGDGGASPEPRATILDLFDRQVAERPDAAALVAEDGAFTYRELDSAANRLAHTLRHRLASPTGIPSGHADFSDSPRIALVAERRAELLVGLLAILKAGAAYVPVDPDFPADRVALMLEDSGCVAVLVSRSLVGDLSAPAGVPVIGLDEVDASLPDSAPDVAVGPDSLAYLIYTSGSTGKPKGTRLFHRNAASFFAALPQAFGFAPGQRLLAITTVSFDIAGLELLGALACGMTVVLASAATARDPARIVERIGSERVEVLQSTPTRLKLLVEQAGIASLAALRTVLVGGEALPQDLADQLASLPDTAVFNVYGPTETTIWSAACRVVPGPVSLGHALPGEKLFVLSSHKRLQPVGAVGELAIAGDGVGGAYHNRPELSAERFPAIPALCEGPVYLTGDLARWLPDGRLEFLGRGDGQIKIRGMRIEPAEIEQQLRRYPGVRDAVVVAVKNERGFADLVAYLAADAAPDIADCRAFLAKELPEPCLPSLFVTLSALPQTPNGKIDRRALPKPEPLTVPSEPTSARAAANPREQAILSAFAAVLANPIGPEDDYFAHGGDSIRALRFVARLREMGYALELEALFRHPTAAALAPCLAAHEETARSQATDDSAPTFTGLDGDELDELFA
jgi:amino acid adenylation domain-containing protein